MSLIAGRYARALLDLAISDDAVNEYQNELTAVTLIYEAESDLNAFLLSPHRDLAVKRKLLVSVFSGAVSGNILNFLLLLLDKGRIELLPDICRAYVKMADEHRNILNITVATAMPLSKAQTDSIGEKFKAVYHGSSVKITVKTDSSLIGGIKVVVNDKLYDGTIRGRLSKMRSAIAGQ